MKNLYELMMQKSSHISGISHLNNPVDDEPMFTRRPLGGMSCASCEKDVTNIYGRKADFIPWGKLPSRDPSERIARVSSFTPL